MEYPGHISQFPIKNVVSLSQMSLEITHETSNILFLGSVIEGEHDQIGSNE